MSIVAIIQARVGSTRLPYKVLMDIEGKPMVARVVERVKKANLDRVILAIPNTTKDEVLSEWAGKSLVDSFAGSENDLLDRYFQAAVLFDADTIVRITSDCPCIDPDMINRAVEFYKSHDFEYVTFGDLSKPDVPDYPEGFDIEIFSFDTLLRAWLVSKDREHVGMFMYKNCRYGFLPFEYKLPERLYVNNVDDLIRVRNVYDRLGENFGLNDILKEE